MNKDSFSRISPFAVFMAFIAVEEGLHFLNNKHLVSLPPHFFLYLYPLRAIATAFLLVLYYKRYEELKLTELRVPKTFLTSIGAGITVFVLWIAMDWTVTPFGSPSGYNPTLISNEATRFSLTAVRLTGAVLVVPLMEEIFWRSFLLRYLVNPDFSKVPIGTFTPTAFVISTILFGLEHNQIAAGMMAGAAYNLLLRSTKSISACVVAHAITNLLLGIYVLQTGKWHLW